MFGSAFKETSKLAKATLIQTNKNTKEKTNNFIFKKKCNNNNNNNNNKRSQGKRMVDKQEREKKRCQKILQNENGEIFQIGSTTSDVTLDFPLNFLGLLAGNLGAKK
ncbi:MAG: hypothetical protein Q8P67_12935, partial [archaeon]|nr:hypothetical protein [archaeon]